MIAPCISRAGLYCSWCSTCLQAAVRANSVELGSCTSCRRQLQEKEEALAAAADSLAEIDQHMHSLAAKYDKTLARLAEDRKAVATEEAERDAEESAVQSTKEQAVAAQATARKQQEQFDEQVVSHTCHVSLLLKHVVHLILLVPTCADAVCMGLPPLCTSCVVI